MELGWFGTCASLEGVEAQEGNDTAPSQLNGNAPPAPAQALRKQHHNGKVAELSIGDDEELSDDDSIHPRDLVSSGGEAKLQQKFLNRLAEIFARQKTPPRSRAVGSSTDADHVSAAILGFKDAAPCLYVAKNRGLDDEDKVLLAKLQTWLRAVSLTRQRRDAEKDNFWLTLMEYNSSRLEFYVTQIANMESLGDHASVQILQEKCKKYAVNSEPSESNLMSIIADAYTLRYNAFPGIRQRAVRAIGFLTRLRAAWETLQEFAMYYPSCANLELQHIEGSGVVKVPISIIRRELDNLQQGLSTGIAAGHGKKPWKHLELHTHAEIQPLLYYGRHKHAPDFTQFVPYMGSSKKTCWLCEQTLRHQAGFSSRGSHGEVSPHWTIETKSLLGPKFLNTLVESMYAIQEALVARVRGPPGPHQVAVPQSTPAVTSSGSARTIANMNRRRQHNSERHYVESFDTTYRDMLPRVLVRRVERITAICLPADNETPCVETLDLCENLKCGDSTGPFPTFPDFRPFWGEVLYTQPEYQMLEVKGQENKACEGTYMVFYNLSEDLPLNNCVSRMLRIKATEVAETQLFWKGDVFVIHFDDDAPGGGAFMSLPLDANMQDVLTRYLQWVWEQQNLEAMRGSRQQLREFSERNHRNRELVRSRLSPLQIEILKHQPLGLEAHVEYLAATEGDYGAVKDMCIEPCPGDPSMVNVRYMKKVEKLERLGWEGFSADQL
ncbi:hypothetical protein LTR17_018263 [Elasticomyces elasticus]|nr:hypothetical protein LTR17_018263 [Elasticomyces elasticus]